jgi:polyisoprenoid-binding protein YceI
MLRRTLAFAALLLSACAPQVREAPSAKAPPDFPRAFYEQAAAQGKTILRIDPAASLVVLTVRRGGSLARFGHDHVVASHDLQGYVAPDAGRADLYVVLDGLKVDEQALRAEAGLDTQPSESDIEGTRTNMREKVLETSKFPFALIHAAAAGEGKLSLDITLHGMRKSFEIPARIGKQGTELSAQGALAFNQSDFGITPFSILGGAVQVQDRVELRFRVLARKGGPGDL